MSWDIWGQPLRAGHCEAHPHIHETFPCSECIAEGYRSNSEQRAYDMAINEQQNRQYEEMEREQIAAEIDSMEYHIGHA